jgi:hypothetical protein
MSRGKHCLEQPENLSNFLEEIQVLLDAKALLDRIHLTLDAENKIPWELRYELNEFMGVDESE